VTSDFEVVVVGGGGSGLAAATRAAQLGLKVVVLERCQELGGTTGIAVGSYTSSGTRHQKVAGVTDSPADHEDDLTQFAPPEIEARNNKSMRTFFLGHTARTHQWLESMGLRFVGPSPEPPNQKPRMHNVIPGAKAYVATFQLELRKHGGVIHSGVADTELIIEQDRVVGVSGVLRGEKCRWLASRGVILAGGDYSSNPEMIARYKGEQFGQIEGINPRAIGAGHRLAIDAGADMVNMDVTYGPELRFVTQRKQPFQQWLPTAGWRARVLGFIASKMPNWIMNRMIKRLLVTWQHPEDSLFDDGAILVNRDGDRFVNESNWPDREIAVADQNEKQAYIIMDDRLIQLYSVWPKFISTAPDIAYAYVKDYQRLRPDVTHLGTSISAVAESANLPSKQLRLAIEESDELDPASNRWAVLGPVKAYFTTTEGGAMVNQQMQVLGDAHEPINGLYAVGQNGLSGMILWSHGLHIAWAMTSGRLAGECLASTNPIKTG